MEALPVAESTAPPRRALTFIFLTVFLDLLGAGILVPVLPYLVRRYDADALTVGLLAATFSAAQFFASPLMGAWSDRAGRRPVLLISLFGTGVGYLLFGWGGSLLILYLSRLIDGFTGGNLATAQAYIADVTPPKDRAKNFGLIGAAFGMGFTFGPAAGGLLSHVSLEAPAYAAAVLSLATTAFGYFALPESLPRERRHKLSWRPRDLDPLLPILRYLRRPEFVTLLAATFFFQFAFSGMQSNFAVYTLERFRWGPDDNAWIFVYLGVVATVVQGWLVRRLAPLWGERRLALSGPLLTTVGFMATAFAPQAWWLFLGITLTAMGSGLAGPSLTSLLSGRATAQEQGTLLGVSQSIGSLTRVLGPAFAGWIFDAAGPPSPYWTGAAFILVAWGCVVAALGKR